MGIPRGNVIAVSGYEFESGETEDVYAQQWGATNGNQFILWLSEEGGNKTFVFGDKDSLHQDTTITLTFNKYIPTIVEATDENSLDSAIAEVQEGGTVKIDNNINLTKHLVINKPITLDLGANNIEAGAQAVLILGDTTVTGTGTINSSHQQSAVQVENAKLTLAGGNINSTTLYGINLVGDSELEINGGNVHSKDSCISSNNKDSEHSMITIEDG